MTVPLAFDTRGSDGLDGSQNDGTTESESLTRPVVQIALAAALSSLLFGYDSAVCAGVLLVIQDQFGELSSAQLEWIVSSALIGALVGSLLASPIVDWSRKYAIVIGSGLFLLGSIEQAAATVYPDMILGRVLVGLAIGLTSQCLPVYLGEIAGSKVRGRLVAMLVVAITAGQLVAYGIDAVFLHVHDGFRWMCGLGAVPALAQLLLSFTIPESPRLDVYRGRIPRARQTLKMLNPTESGDEIQARIDVIQQEADASNPSPKSISGLKDRLSSWFRTTVDHVWRDRLGRKTVAIAITLQFFQQATGFNAVLYYSGQILQRASFANPIAAAMVVTVANLACTVIALNLIDSVGRRALLLRTLPGMTLGMMFVGICFLFISPDPTTGANAWSYLSVIAMAAFTCAYSLGIGHVPWVIQSEIFTPEVRATGGALATGTNWFVNFLVASTFLRLRDALTETGIFWLYGGVAMGAWTFTWFCLPETKGKSLAEIKELFTTDDDHVTNDTTTRYSALASDEL